MDVDFNFLAHKSSKMSGCLPIGGSNKMTQPHNNQPEELGSSPTSVTHQLSGHELITSREQETIPLLVNVDKNAFLSSLVLWNVQVRSV